MTTTTGVISLKGVNAELRQTLGGQISMSAASGRTLAGVPSGQISMSNFRGKTVGSTLYFFFNDITSGGALGAWSWSAGFGSKFSAPTGTASGYSVANASGVARGMALLGDVVFRGQSSSPRIYARKFTGAGWGTLYSTNSINAQLTNIPEACAPHPNGRFVAYLDTGANWYLDIFDFFSESVDSLSAGWGCTYLIPLAYSSGTLAVPGTPNDIAWSRGGRAIAIAHATSPRITIYPFDGASAFQSNNGVDAQYTRGVGFGTIYSNPATLPNSTARSVAFTNGAIILASRGTNSGFLEAWAWSDSTGFGTKYSNPATDFTTEKVGSSGNPLVLRASPNQSYLAVGGAWNTTHSTTPSNNLFLYDWNDSTGFGTLYSNPTNSTTSNNSVSGAKDLAWTNDSASLAVVCGVGAADNTTIPLRAWAISGGWSTQYSDITSVSTIAGYAAAFK